MEGTDIGDVDGKRRGKKLMKAKRARSQEQISEIRIRRVVTRSQSRKAESKNENPVHKLFQALASANHIPLFFEGPGSGELRTEDELTPLRASVLPMLKQKFGQSATFAVFGQGDRPNKGVSSFIDTMTLEVENVGVLAVVDHNHHQNAYKDGFTHVVYLHDALQLTDDGTLQCLRREINKRAKKEWKRKYALLQEGLKLAAKQYFPSIAVVQTVATGQIPKDSVTSHYIHGLKLGYVSNDELISLCNGQRDQLDELHLPEDSTQIPSRRRRTTKKGKPRKSRNSGKKDVQSRVC